MLRSVQLTLQMIKWEHTIFAMPFAFIGLLVASDGRPSLVTLAWIVFARAMTTLATYKINFDRR